jgi:hypothetical protein
LRGYIAADRAPPSKSVTAVQSVAVEKVALPHEHDHRTKPFKARPRSVANWLRPFFLSADAKGEARRPPHQAMVAHRRKCLKSATHLDGGDN